MDTQNSQSPPGGATSPIDERYTHKRFENYEQLSDGTYKRTIDNSYCAPNHDDRIGDLSAQDLDSWFGTMQVVEETVIFKRLPGNGWKRMTVKFLHMPSKQDNLEALSEKDQPGPLSTPVSHTPSQMPADTMHIIGSPACAKPLVVSKPDEGLCVSSSSAQESASLGGGLPSGSERAPSAGHNETSPSTTTPATAPSAASDFWTRRERPSAVPAPSRPLFNFQPQSGRSLASRSLFDISNVESNAPLEVQTPLKQSHACSPKSALTTALGTSLPLNPTLDGNEYLETITAQPWYSKHSLEELRAADYAQGRSRAPPPESVGLFGGRNSGFGRSSNVKKAS